MMRWPRSTDSLRRRQILTALAALLLAGLLVWLMLRPDSFGAVGGAARTGIFGQHLAGIAGGDGRDTTGSPDSSRETESAATNRNAVSPPVAPSATTTSAPVSSPDVPPREGAPEATSPATSPAPPTNAITTNIPVRAAGAPVMRINDDFSPRLSAAGAKTGEVQISLVWNNVNDLDLHCQDPSGDEIFYGARFSRLGGQLDVDRNAGFPLTATPVENIYWPAAGAPLGMYVVSVVHYHHWGGSDPTPYKVRILIRGQEMVFTGSLSYPQRKEVHQFILTARQ